MDEKNVEKKFEELSNDLSKFMHKHNEELTNIGNNHEETKKALEKLESKWEEAGVEKEKMDQLKSQQEQLDKIETELKNKIGGGKRKSMTDKIGEALNSDNIKAFKEGNSSKGTIDLGMKMSHVLKAADMTTANTYTGDVIEPDFDNRIYRDPVTHLRNVRSLIPVGSTQSDSYRYISETAYDDGTAAVAEANTLGQSDFDLQRKTAPVEAIGAFKVITEEMLEDTEGLTSYINQVLLEYYRLEEDDQFLYGDGSSPNLTGLDSTVAAYTDILSDSGANKYDVLAAAVTNVAENKYMANGILLHPRDRMKLLLVKDSQDMFVYPGDVRAGGNINVDGVPVYVSLAVNQGDFFVGDWSRVAQILDRKGAVIEFAREDSTNFRSREITCRITGRVAFPIRLPNAMVYGDFASAEAQATG